MTENTPVGVLKNRMYSLVSNELIPYLKSAAEYAEEFYNHKTRFNGEPMFNHTLRTATSVLEKGIDVNTAIATLFHELDFNEETMSHIERQFSKDVVDILNGVKNIKRGTDSIDSDSEIIVKYILNISKDIRPIILKIFDTLEDIRSFDEIPEDQKKRKLVKALEIYGVLAEYLYFEDTKKELEEKAFQHYLPLEFESITKKMTQLNISEELKNKYRILLEESVKSFRNKPKIHGRIKNKYSIYNKLKKYEKERVDPNINRRDDLIAFRIITNTEDEAYLAMEKIMDRGIINDERFDDYIANPKPNGYKAVQTPIQFPEISPMYIEVQILTHEMLKQNTFGSASHIAYKASQSRYAKATNEYDWVKNIHNQIEESKHESRKKLSFPIKADIFPDEVFAFTPGGKIIALEKGYTVLDFAFKLHTDIGNSAESAKVNNKPAKLSQVIESGDIVEIRTDKNKTHQKATAIDSVKSIRTKHKMLKSTKNPYNNSRKSIE